MSQLERQKEERAGKKSSRDSKAKANGEGTLVSFNPNEPQKLAIKHLAKSPETVMSAACRVMTRGVKLTLGFMPGSEAYYCIAREIAEDWQKARAISAVHIDPLTAMASLVYACEDVYVGFPDCELTRQGLDIDW